jgi:hypothetical protein
MRIYTLINIGRRMDVRRVATEAIELLRYPNEKLDEMTVYRTALIGFFTGVAKGQITIGQEWPVDILLNHTKIASKDQFEMIEQVFSSGILCQGQLLTNAKKPSFTGRTNS